MILAAHQPNFFPAGSFYAKARRADVFVLLAHVQYERGGYHNRFNIPTFTGEPEMRFRYGENAHRTERVWYTMSVSQRLEPLADKRYSAPEADWQAIKRKLPAYRDVLDGFDDCIGASLVETNTAIIRRIFDRIGIDCRVVMDHPTERTATERLVELCQRHGADVYLSGPSGRKYLDVAAFDAAGIRVDWQDAVAPRAVVEMLAEVRP